MKTLFKFKMITQFIISTAVVVMAQNAGASVVGVSANQYSENHCAYFHSERSDFHFSFSDHWPSTAKVFVHFGFINNWNGVTHWHNIQDQELAVTGPHVWEGDVQNMEVSSRGYFSFTGIEFVFHIIQADGTEYWDNGGFDKGYYVAELPVNTCERGPLQKLETKLVRGN